MYIYICIMPPSFKFLSSNLENGTVPQMLCTSLGMSVVHPRQYMNPSTSLTTARQSEDLVAVLGLSIHVTAFFGLQLLGYIGVILAFESRATWRFPS